jgi:MarR family transcriptional regulator, lower aerobic nicotinate degradation pathway regulator
MSSSSSARPLRSSPPRTRRRQPDLGLVDALVQSSFLVQAVIGEVVARYDLSIIQARLLGVLRDREPRMAQLAQLLGLTKSSTTGLVDRAERHGLVRRATIPVGDERAVHVLLTDEGRRLEQQVRTQTAKRLTTLADGLSRTGRAQLSKALTQLVLYDAELSGTDLAPSQPTSRSED